MKCITLHRLVNLYFINLDCANVPHGKITDEIIASANSPQKQVIPTRYGQTDMIYSLDNHANLTCDSGYVINHQTYIKWANVKCTYTLDDGSTWKLISPDGKETNQTAACIRGIS